VDKLKQYIEQAQEKTSQEKHSIALVIASAVSGGLFVIWLSISLYNLSKTPPAEVPAPASQAQQLIDDASNVFDTLSVPQNGGAQEPTYVDLDSVPAVYRPDSTNDQTQTTTIREITTPPEETTVQGSDTPTSVIE
jgi:cytoskeletal protein RodZ